MLFGFAAMGRLCSESVAVLHTGLIGGRNIRAEELLNNLGINDREITNDVFPNINGAVNWEKVDNVLLKERNKSKEYINKIKELIQNESSEVTV